MKKLNLQPEAPCPKEYDNFKEEIKKLNREQSLKTLNDMDLDFAKLPSLKVLLKNFKSNELVKDMKEKMSSIVSLEDLEQEPTEAIKKEILLYVMNQIEEFILEPKAGAKKKAMAIEILKSMFHNDEVITGLMIDSLITGIRQVKLFRRLYLKFRRYLKKK